MNKKLVIFNLKMNPSSFREARKLVDFTQNYAEKFGGKTEIIIAPPFIYIPILSAKGGSASGGKIANCKLKIGAQNVFWANEGAYTGEISPEMLKGLGAEYVIIGHSERRKYLCETDEMINKKVLTALKGGLKVILCVGEDLATRKRGIKAVKNFIKGQLQKDLAKASSFKLQAPRLIIAYEPIWAIGTGKACKPEDALEVIKFIKNFTSFKLQASSFKVLYGGSVDSKNILDFVKYKEIDGVLVGGASLKPKEVAEIIKKVG